MVTEFIINISDLVDVLKEQVDECLKVNQHVGGDFNADVIVACWLSLTLADNDIRTEFNRPAMRWETYSCILNIKNDYASRLVSEIVVPPILDVFPSGTWLIAQMRVDGRNLYLKF